MQKIYPRTNPMPFEAPENSNARPIPQIDDALREFARLDVSSRRVAENAAPANLSPEPESSAQVVADINSLVQRVAGVSLDQLDDVIVDLRQLRDCGFRRMRTVIPIDCGQRFRSIADSVPVIADSCSRRRL
jgi:hypothetical protein